MVYSIRSADLSNLGPEQRASVCDALAPTVPTKSGLPLLEARIRRYEINHEISSAEMMRKVARGELKETADIARWRILLGLRDDGHHAIR